MADRLDAMRVFVAVLDEGSLAGAGRRLARSPAAVTRAVASLEAHVGAQLLHRTARRLQLTEVGARYAAVCRRVLTDLDEADLSAAGDQAAPRGVLTVTAPVMFGTRVLRPIVGAFLRAYPAVQIRYLLLNRMTSLVDEGIDVALRIAPLPSSALIALRIGEVRRVLCASPAYLARRPAPACLADLAGHDCIGVEPTSPDDVWTFPPAPGGRGARTVRVRPRLMVNADEAAVSAAIDGEGIVRMFSYKIQQEVADGRLVILLPGDEPPPVPVHLVASPERLALAKVRTFMDFAGARLRADLDRAAPGSGRGPDAVPRPESARGHEPVHGHEPARGPHREGARPGIRPRAPGPALRPD
ncbi:HTH-type transcriptional regulator DmlR [Methylobacterium crusticola]|uniref:HTH-type transcriptional regulator DmlR n=1 Tax=Methylobacterium crusticola TaxID=1697972 RepID=A0ABQ4QSY7_9HYPH|nr:LysR family transcriptional regulator [Methylobacterium crusticola]GJD48005.1 HTH-type transcriptional regulator DmlR [Methylobacterium crusticola]